MSEETKELVIGTDKLTDVTEWIYSQISPGQIAKFGNGWLMRCPECKQLLSIENEFKTFSVKNKEQMRISPSVKCGHKDCNYHKSISIEAEPVHVSSEQERPDETEEFEVIDGNIS